MAKGLVPAECLVNGATILREAPGEQVAYFHLELDSHDVLLAEGAPAESYINLDNRNLFANAFEYVASSTMQFPAVEYAPRTEHGPALTALRQSLATRAEALGFTLPVAHLVALTTPGVTRATVPPGVEAVHFCSTAESTPDYACAARRRTDRSVRPLSDQRLPCGGAARRAYRALDQRRGRAHPGAQRPRAGAGHRHRDLARPATGGLKRPGHLA